ncbi:MAG TPA: group 1 truncated hemoglobin [Longimicrobiales bacterium]|nr:group 1 truncated hemoglobin [Longimicrobiales bacterium]
MRGNSTFDRLGGFARIRLLVSDFYERVLDHPDLTPYFERIDMARLIDHQTKFMSAVMGGPAAFTNDQISRAHTRLGIRPEHFDTLADLFRETLEDFGVDAAEVATLHAHVLSMREHVVGSP